MKLTDREEKNSLICDQLMDVIQQVHGSMRPFIIIFPSAADTDEESVASSLTNIAVMDVRMVLAEFLQSLEGLEEMETMGEAKAN